MERRVTVNDRIERLELEVPPELQATETPGKAAGHDPHGPCLYFGPKGERCSRHALEGGYCAAHQSNGAARSYGRVLAATIALILIVWPYISDLVRDLLHWLAASH
jgi:hypothetical protein